MPRVCSICKHPDLRAIDEALVTGRGSFRGIARQYRVSPDAVERHRRQHLAAHLVQAQQAQEVTSASSLLEQMMDLQRRTLEILAAPENQRVAVAAIAQARGNVQLLAELTGRLATQPTVNILVSAEWVTVRTAVLEALEPFPEARTSVATRLLALEGGDDGHRR